MTIQHMLERVINHLQAQDKSYNWEVEFVDSPSRDEYARQRGYYLHCDHEDKQVSYAGKDSSKSAQYTWKSHLQGKFAGMSFMDVVENILDTLIQRVQDRDRTIEHLRGKVSKLAAIAEELADRCEQDSDYLNCTVCTYCHKESGIYGAKIQHSKNCPVRRLEELGG